MLAVVLCAVSPAQAQTVSEPNESQGPGAQSKDIEFTRDRVTRFDLETVTAQPADTDSSSRAKEATAKKINEPESASSAASTPTRPDLNKRLYRKHNLDFSLEVGRYHNNIPFVFDFLLGDGYNMPPLDYTLVPIVATLRWQMSDVKGPGILRGNWEGVMGGTYTIIPRGPETRYFGYVVGIQRNLIYRRWKVVPYLEGRVGAGNINAKEPKGVLYAQGQDFTFTLMLDSGFRYNVNPKYSIFVGAGYMHISNLYLSEPAYPNYGINVYGPKIGIDYHLGRRHETSY